MDKSIDGLIDILQEKINMYSDNISLVFKDMNGNIGNIDFRHNADKKVSSASIIKVPIMIEALKQEEDGKFNLYDKVEIKENNKVDFSVVTEIGQDEFTIEELIVWMTIQSDNTATNELIDLLGYDNINNLIAKCGMTNTVLQRKMMDTVAREQGIDNFTSVADIAKLFEKIYSRDGISESICKKALDILKRQRHKDRLMAYICDDIVLANKTGSLDGITHDIGIFYAGDKAYILGVFVVDLFDENKANNIIGNLSKAIYDFIK